MDSIHNVDVTVGRATALDGYRPAAKQNTSDGQTRPLDKVELTDAGLQLSRRDDLTDVRAGLIDRVRGEIADETYQSNERINVTIERLMGELADLDTRI